MRLIAKVVGQLDLHRPLDHPLRQLGQQAALAGDLLTSEGAGHQLIDQLVRQKLLDAIDELGIGVRAARSASASLRSPSGLAPRHAGAPILRILRLIQPAVNCAGHRSPFEI